jgi:hypothetical protein
MSFCSKVIIFQLVKLKLKIIINTIYDSVKQERDMFREDLQHSKLTADNLRIELQVNKGLKGLSGES